MGTPREGRIPLPTYGSGSHGRWTGSERLGFGYRISGNVIVRSILTCELGADRVQSREDTLEHVRAALPVTGSSRACLYSLLQPQSALSGLCRPHQELNESIGISRKLAMTRSS